MPIRDLFRTSADLTPEAAAGVSKVAVRRLSNPRSNRAVQYVLDRLNATELKDPRHETPDETPPSVVPTRVAACVKRAKVIVLADQEFRGWAVAVRLSGFGCRGSAEPSRGR